MVGKDVFTRILGISESVPVLMLAPMEGITNSLIRRLIGRLGAVDLVVTEFIRLTSEKQKIQPIERHETPLQIQIMGTTPEIVGGCVRFLKARGILKEDDWLDLNVGCPSRRVNSRGAGAALLLEPERLSEIVGRLREEHQSGPLSIKTRLGFQSEEEFPRILEALKPLPLDFITIHGRTKCQSYAGKVSLFHVKEAVSFLPYPVIGNGDIWSVTDGIEMLKITGARGIMCGRGAIANPFLFNELRQAFQGCQSATSDEVRLLELRKFYREFLDELLSSSTPKRNFVGTAKEVICWSHRNDLIGPELFQRVKRNSDLTTIRHTVDSFLAEKIDEISNARDRLLGPTPELSPQLDPLCFDPSLR